MLMVKSSRLKKESVKYGIGIEKFGIDKVELTPYLHESILNSNEKLQAHQTSF